LVLIIDSLLVGGVRFVLDKLVQAVDAELNDDTVLREELLAAQMRLELGEITEEQFADIERDLLARIREVRSRNTAPPPAPGEMRIAGIEATFTGEEHAVEESPATEGVAAGVERGSAPPAAARPRKAKGKGKGEAGHGRRR
jgi:gas vesicle protein GvpG